MYQIAQNKEDIQNGLNIYYIVGGTDDYKARRPYISLHHHNRSNNNRFLMSTVQ